MVSSWVSRVESDIPSSDELPIGTDFDITKKVVVSSKECRGEKAASSVIYD